MLPLHANCSFDHLKVLDKFETSDLDLQGKICHKTLNVCVIACECDYF